MKKLLLLTFFCIRALAQDPFAAPLSSWDIYNISATPSGKVWILSHSGTAFYKNPNDSLLHFTFPDGKSPDEFRSDQFVNIDFFNDDIGFVSGMLFAEGARHNFVYRTHNGGKTWQEVVFGKPSKIDLNTTCVTQNGNAWITGSSNLIYYSSDFGKSWAELNGPIPPNGKDRRLTKIHFINNKTGIVALSSTDGMYITADNCTTWQAIPTPFSQKKYIPDDPDDTSLNMYKLRIWANGARYITNIEGHVYTTLADNIDWVKLGNVCNFEVTENGGLYLMYNDGSVELKDKNANTVWKSATGLLSPGPVCVTNNILYAKTNDMLFSISPAGITRTELLTADMPIEEPYQTVTAGKEWLGFEENYVLRYDDEQEKWARFIKAPFAVTHIAMQGENVVIGNYDLQKYLLVNLQSKTLEEYKLPETLISPDVKITSIKFERGSRGCFHSRLSSVTYQPEGQRFTFKGQDSIGNLPRTLSARRVQEFTNALNNHSKYRNTVNDFDFSKKDIENFIALVDSTQAAYATDAELYGFDHKQITFHGSRPDFDFYRRQVHLIDTYTTEDINKMLLRLQDGYSTTVNWLAVTIGLSDGTFVRLSNDDYNPYYMHAPWSISINGLLMRSTSLQLANEIDLLTGGHFLDIHKKDKRYALFLLIDNAYRTMVDNK